MPCPIPVMLGDPGMREPAVIWFIERWRACCFVQAQRLQCQDRGAEILGVLTKLNRVLALEVTRNAGSGPGTSRVQGLGSAVEAPSETGHQGARYTAAGPGSRD